MPELVKEDTRGYLTVNYLGTTALLVEGMKKQQEMIEKLPRRNLPSSRLRGRVRSSLAPLDLLLLPWCENVKLVFKVLLRLLLLVIRAKAWLCKSKS